MAKIVKLTEEDLLKMVNKAMSEQMSSMGKLVSDFKNPVPPTDQKLGFGPSAEILSSKRNVQLNLGQALNSMKKLVTLSGVNPSTNNIVQDIEKVMDKFENLYGEPKVEEK